MSAILYCQALTMLLIALFPVIIALNATILEVEIFFYLIALLLTVVAIVIGTSGYRISKYPKKD